MDTCCAYCRRPGHPTAAHHDASLAAELKQQLEAAGRFGEAMAWDGVIRKLSGARSA